MKLSEVNIFWFRRDLRLEDQAGLYHALKKGLPVVPVFIFDRNILDELEDPNDRRVAFIHDALNEIQKQLLIAGSTLDVRYGFPEEVWKQILKDYKVRNVFVNHDYEPYARERDQEISELLRENGISFHSYKDQVIFEKDQVIKDDGSPYTVFTPYSRKWKNLFQDNLVNPFQIKKYFGAFFCQEPIEIQKPKGMTYRTGENEFPSKETDIEKIKEYHKQRDLPAADGTSKLSVHLRFGTISIRKLVKETGKINASFLNELIWREFYQMILWHFPEVVSSSFKPVYDRIPWRNDPVEFKAWCDGCTGYPIVDAGMRELNETGFMHNRVRMITASFLCKHLLIDWRWGESYFAKKLLDFDLASNNGGWQWAAGSGCDAAPYFRVFNPYLQTKKFDPDFKYIRKWVPEFESGDYPEVIVDHKEARERCLRVYKNAVSRN